MPELLHQAHQVDAAAEQRASWVAEQEAADILTRGRIVADLLAHRLSYRQIEDRTGWPVGSLHRWNAAHWKALGLEPPKMRRGRPPAPRSPEPDGGYD